MTMELDNGASCWDGEWPRWIEREEYGEEPYNSSIFCARRYTQPYKPVDWQHAGPYIRGRGLFLPSDMYQGERCLAPVHNWVANRSFNESSYLAHVLARHELDRVCSELEYHAGDGCRTWDGWDMVETYLESNLAIVAREGEEEYHGKFVEVDLFEGEESEQTSQIWTFQGVMTEQRYKLVESQLQAHSDVTCIYRRGFNSIFVQATSFERLESIRQLVYKKPTTWSGTENRIWKVSLGVSQETVDKVLKELGENPRVAQFTCSINRIASEGEPLTSRILVEAEPESFKVLEHLRVRVEKPVPECLRPLSKEEQDALEPLRKEDIREALAESAKIWERERSRGALGPRRGGLRRDIVEKKPWKPKRKIDVSAELQALRNRVKVFEDDLAKAAGMLLVEIPQPGTDMARLLSANVLLRHENSDLRSKISDLKEELSNVSKGVEWRVSLPPLGESSDAVHDFATQKRAQEFAEAIADNWNVPIPEVTRAPRTDLFEELRNEVKSVASMDVLEGILTKMDQVMEVGLTRLDLDSFSPKPKIRQEQLNWGLLPTLQKAVELRSLGGDRPSTLTILGHGTVSIQWEGTPSLSWIVCPSSRPWPGILVKVVGNHAKKRCWTVGSLLKHFNDYWKGSESDQFATVRDFDQEPCVRQVSNPAVSPSMREKAERIVDARKKGIWDLAEKAQAEVDQWPEWKRRAADMALVTRAVPEQRRSKYILMCQESKNSPWMVHKGKFQSLERVLEEIESEMENGTFGVQVYTWEGHTPLLHRTKEDSLSYAVAVYHAGIGKVREFPMQHVEYANALSKSLAEEGAYVCHVLLLKPFRTVLSVHTSNESWKSFP